LSRLSLELRSEVDISQLQSHLASVITETLQPEQVSLWLRPLGKKQPRLKK